ncbi:helix-turn-helix domain-containing protein [Thermopolyspora sp. NPDC052614]|uniref:helix-turn-helix domain-containing protein n=1 Tax=Thermopolyspora sp. NPDC052614 TaxID=3155682 RepID=UPI00341A0305
MGVLVRTRDLPAAHRREEWLNVICDVLGPLDTKIGVDGPPDGEIAADRLGPVGVGRVKTSTPHSVHRTPRLIRSSDPELYRVLLVMSGSPIVVQDGRSTRLNAGEFAIYDFARPYDLVYDAAVHLAVFSLPRETLALPKDAAANLTAVPIGADDGTGALAAPLLRRVALDLETYRPATAARLSTVVTDLVTTAVAERAERYEAVPAESRSRTLLLSIHAFIDRHLGDPTLSPADIAAAHHVSLRQLHRLFETEKTTVAAWIRQRRLERCRRDLADPALHATPVGVIAARWGLPDSAHFSRIFRQAYGMPPAEYRRTRLMPQV